jgi:hypothetical protein
MKKALVLCALVGVAVYATSAWSAPTADPTVTRLVKDVASLKKDNAALKKQVATLKKTVGEDEVAIGATILFAVCSDEITADALQGTWVVVDQVSAALQGGKTYFGPQTPVTATLQGQDVCAGGGITRSPVTSGTVPTVAGYQALLAGFHSSSLKALLSYAFVHEH